MLLDSLKLAARFIFKILFRIEIRGLENYRSAGDRVLVIANHASYLDAVLLVLFLPGRLAYAINTHVAQRWWVKPFLHFVDFCPMDPVNPLSLKTLIQYLQQNRTAVIFPEGRMTVTGALMKIYQGPSMVVEKTGATLLPVYLDGVQYTPLSRMKGIFRLRWLPKITITIMEPVKLDFDESQSGHTRREVATQQMEDLMADMMFKASNYHQTLFRELLRARQTHGGRYKVVDDINRMPLSYNQLIMRSIILGRLLSRKTGKDENVGVLLPTSSAAVLLFMACHVEGRVPALLNCSAGTHALRNSMKAARIGKIITSRKFIETAKLESVLEELKDDAEIIYLEDLRKEVRSSDKFVGILVSRFLTGWYYRLRSGKKRADDPAVILFTSGSEGMPKGVVLSHANILANYFQLASRFAFGPAETLLNVLPVFHSFGLTAGVLLPLFSGMRVFLYPSPLHYRIIPEVAYDIGATVMFSTNTFLNGYAKYAHPYDFYRIRYVFAGAEALSEKTRQQWFEKFGIRIYQGYGATETAPVLSANTPFHYRAGSVGRFMPGIEYCLKDVEGIEDGKRLMVRGANIMLGYYLSDNPGVLVPPETEDGAGWYDTGDIVSIDEDGYMFIRGRAKRFAKIGGEMVSLAVVEELANRTWPEALNAVISTPDPGKGEQLLLFTEHQEAGRQEIVRQAQQDGISELFIPKKIISLNRIPVMASGKINYQALAEYRNLNT